MKNRWFGGEAIIESVYKLGPCTNGHCVEHKCCCIQCFIFVSTFHLHRSRLALVHQLTYDSQSTHSLPPSLYDLIVPTQHTTTYCLVPFPLFGLSPLSTSRLIVNDVATNQYLPRFVFAPCFILSCQLTALTNIYLPPGVVPL